MAIFEQVCQAVAYAHAHGVIHPIVRRWRLAKLLPEVAPPPRRGT